LGDGGEDGLDPVRCGDRIVVDIGDVMRAGRPGTGIAGQADAGLVKPDEPGVVLVGEHFQVRHRGWTGGAVHQQNREPVTRNGLLSQSVKAIAHIAGAVAGANADGEVHAGRLGRKD
jgi:hypothetical protein